MAKMYNLDLAADAFLAGHDDNFAVTSLRAAGKQCLQNRPDITRDGGANVVVCHQDDTRCAGVSTRTSSLLTSDGRTVPVALGSIYIPIVLINDISTFQRNTPPPQEKWIMVQGCA